ncbi:P-loop containing nucleoside triphosphate hydrolase protein [Rhexocercosporidium sp. MPI-PUGE-AT-0058]|nr:P-loop containing nucleoside triphosphate hydrolase protein [Rhexocercosporidium sp. MPI-PUGE-AT-0058]
MLRKSEVLFLDEATSIVDSEADQVMQTVFKEEFEGYTTLSVAHRLDTIMDSDKIDVLDPGKLVKFETPGNLLARDSPIRPDVPSLRCQFRIA